MDPSAHLPAMFVELAEAGGEKAAWAIVDARGGQEISLPRHANQKHWLSVLLGVEAAENICRYFATKHQSRVLVPNMRHASIGIAVVRAIEAGKSNTQASAATGAHERTVRRWRRRLERPGDDRQGNLF